MIPVSSPNTEPSQKQGDKKTQTRAAERDTEQAVRQQQIDREVARLKQIDREVRAHEQAHKAVGGRYAGPERYEYTQGPDGNLYAVGGEVSIDVSREQKPEATITKMQIVRAAALAPAQPSGQDMKVAATASQLQAEAQQELALQTYKQMQNAASPQQKTGAIVSQYA